MTDREVLEAHHQFVRDDIDDEKNMHISWGVRLARKYYNQLYKEYAIVDLSRYKDIVGMRWRVESEVIRGKGQSMCAEKVCTATSGLCVYEVPFKYEEDGASKTELVKTVVCRRCAKKLHYMADKLSPGSTKHHHKEPSSVSKRRKRDADNYSSAPAAISDVGGGEAMSEHKHARSI
jgi:protein FRA10AC1